MKEIHNIAEICAQKGVRNIVLSPGSRCAPLTIAFSRHPEIKEWTVSDERASAFIGMGLAQGLKQTVGLVCTSGTASLNYAPAVTEAYYQQIPLLVLTADRPPEWIDQLDGQTIRQRNIFSNHIKGSFETPVDLSHPDAKWQLNRTISEAINLAERFPQGPVHVNIPLREPLYPEQGETVEFDASVKTIKAIAPSYALPQEVLKALEDEAKSYKNILVVAGQDGLNPALSQQLASLSIPVVADIISNIEGEKHIVRNQDNFLGNIPEEQAEALQPELLITFGKSLISKNLKLFLRKQKPKAHWHLQTAGEVADTFQALTEVIPLEASAFFKEVKLNSAESFLEAWISADQKEKDRQQRFFKDCPFGEFKAFHKVMNAIPSGSNLHLANSMAVRYANFLYQGKALEVFANRGTSGIDGSTSTAVGISLAQPEKLNILFTGDLSFFYDRNGLWHNYLPANLRIVVMNNHGGGIFKMIPGPRNQPEANPYFVTEQRLKAENTAKDFGMEYHFCSQESELEDILGSFFAEGESAKILEIESKVDLNTEVFLKFKSFQ